MKSNKSLHKLTYILLVIGGLNWLVYGLFSYDVGSLLGGMESALAKIVYILVGLSAVYEIFVHKGYCKYCASESKPAPSNQSPTSSGPAV